MLKANGKRKNLRNLLKNAETHVITATEGDFYYIKVPKDINSEEAEKTIEQLQRIFPKNFVFIIPDHLTIEQLNDEELKRLGLMRIPELKDDPVCPKCKSKNTMKNYNSLQYQKAWVRFLNGRLTFAGHKSPYPKDSMISIFDNINFKMDVWDWSYGWDK